MALVYKALYTCRVCACVETIEAPAYKEGPLYSLPPVPVCRFGCGGGMNWIASATVDGNGEEANNHVAA